MPSRTWLGWLPNGFSLACILLLAANYFSTFGDLDYTWQVRTGEVIVRTGDIRPPEQFSYTIAGLDLPDFEWLYEVVLFFFWDNFGYGGLKLLKVLMVASTLGLVAWRLHAARVRWHGIAFCLVLAIAVLAPAWNLRPLYCTTLGLLLVSGFLHDHCSGRKRLGWLLPLTMLVWANCHPAVIMGQALLASAIGWEWLNQWLKINRPLDRPALLRLTWLGGLGLAATLISPDPLARLLYPFSPTLAHPIQRVFVEMQPLYKTIARAPYTSGLIYLVAAVVALSVALRFRHYRAWEITLMAALALLANTAARAAQDWLLVMLAIGMPHVVALLRQAALADRRRGWVALLLRCDCTWRRLWDSPLLRCQWAWPTAALAGLVIVSLVPAWSRDMPRQEDDEWPQGAIAYMRANNIQGRVFSPPDYGAYVTWHLGDKVRCYTDTRGFFFPPVLLEDSHYLPQLTPGWQARMDRVLDEHQTDYFLLETTGPRGELWRQLQPALQGQPLYVDHQSVVLGAKMVRQAVQAMELAARR